MDTETLTNGFKTKVAQINPERKEGKVATAIEAQTSRLPSDLFLWTAVGALAASLTLRLLKKDHTGLFVGQLAAPILLLGVYNKMVKLQGHDMNAVLPD
jgi:hypothetical protein